MQAVSMLMAKGIFQKIVDFFLGFFAFLPQTIYFLYASMASLLDVLQYLVRKLAGLDVYYVNGVAQSGDIVTDFLKGIVGINKSPAYSAISTVFWSLVIFGVILLILTSIISIIKAHYNYDANKSNPFTILSGALKSLATMVIVPIVSIFGVYLAQIVLMTLDEITSPTATTAISSTYEADAVSKFASDDDGIYTSYDYFSAGGYTKTSTFSGMMFKIAAYDCNRVRSGYYTATTSAGSELWDTADVFYTASGTSSPHEVVAAQIDYAFANNLKLKDKIGAINYGSESDSLKHSLRWGISATFSAGLHNVKSFSKFNVGLVFYYYDLWSFNSILGFAGVLLSAVTLGNIVFGLMGRLLQVVALFVVYPAFIGIMPLDDGNAFGQWRKQFTSDILMSIGAIVGMNIFFLILPFFNTLSFFNNTFLDGIANMIIILAGLTLVKKFISLVSKAIGGGDANDSGGSLRQETTSAAMKGMSGTLKAAGPAGKLIGSGIKGGVTAVGGLVRGIGAASHKSKVAKASGTGKKYKDLSAEEIAAGEATLKTEAEEKARNKAETKATNRYNKKYDSARNSKEEGRIAKFMGRADVSGVVAEDRETYDKFNMLDKNERSAIMDGAYEIEQDADGNDKMDENGNPIYKKDASGNRIALQGDDLRNYLHSQLGTISKSGDAKSQAAWINHQGQSKLRRAKFVGGLFGQDTSKYSATTAAVDDDGNVQVKAGTATIKGFGDAFVDFGQVAFKTAGTITGASAAWKTLGDSGVIDDAKTALQNLTGIKPTEGYFKPLRTKKQGEDQDRDALKQMQKDQLAAQQLSAEYMKKTKKAIDDLTDELKSRASSSGSGGSGGSTP